MVLLFWTRIYVCGRFLVCVGFVCLFMLYPLVNVCGLLCCLVRLDACLFHEIVRCCDLLMGVLSRVSLRFC